MMKRYLSFIFILALIPLTSLAQEGKVDVSSSSKKEIRIHNSHDKEDEDNKSTSTEESSHEDENNTLFTLCSQEAIELRDTKIASSRTIYNLAMTKALSERKNNEKNAIAIKDEDKKKEAIKLSVETYKKEVKQAQTTLTQSRKTIWEDFDEDISRCREIHRESRLEEKEDNTSFKEEKIVSDTKKGNEKEGKSFKETFKNQLESIKSLFGGDK